MPVTNIGGKRAFEAGTVVLPVGTKDFTLSVAAITATIQFTPGLVAPKIGGGVSLVIELPEVPTGGTSYVQETLSNGSVAYTFALAVQAFGTDQAKGYIVHYSVTI